MEEAKSPQTGPFIFYCPHTGLKVQGLAAANDTENDKIYAATPLPGMRGRAHGQSKIWQNPRR
jgi:hypothetical protein